jgi:hypothetical protein
MKGLNSVCQRWTISLSPQILANFNRAIGPHPNEVAVKSRVVKTTQRDAIRYVRIAGRFRVGNDVCRIQEFFVPEATERALP